jgi:hypothetical protein
MGISNKLVSREILEGFKTYFEDVPDRLTVKEAAEYALYCRALDGEHGAYRAIQRTDDGQSQLKINSDSITKKLRKNAKI